VGRVGCCVGGGGVPCGGKHIIIETGHTHKHDTNNTTQTHDKNNITNDHTKNHPRCVKMTSLPLRDLAFTRDWLTSICVCTNLFFRPACIANTVDIQHPTRISLCMPCTIQYWQWQSRVKAKTRHTAYTYTTAAGPQRLTPGRTHTTTTTIQRGGSMYGEFEAGRRCCDSISRSIWTRTWPIQYIISLVFVCARINHTSLYDPRPFALPTLLQ